MRFFVCVIDPEGHAIPEAVQAGYEGLTRRRGLHPQSRAMNGLLLLTDHDSEGRSSVVTSGRHTAVGAVRLDNRAELEHWSGSRAGELSDLALVLQVVLLHEARYIPQFLGDFAFVVSNGDTRRAIAARDAFGVKKLYYAERDGRVAFASQGALLAATERYDVQYLTEFTGMCVPSPGLSAYADVSRVPGGAVAVLESGRLMVRRYWSPATCLTDPPAGLSAADATIVCRDLLSKAVRLRLSDSGETWAQLSGGLDSSSIVSVAQWLARDGDVAGGLSGTVSFVDSFGTGADEREYSDSVARTWNVRNETIVDAPLWYDPEYPLPGLDEPSPALVFYPRDRRLCSIVREAHGRVLLTGVGGDNLFTGNMFFFADWVARGHVGRAVQEMVARAAMGRVSFWELAYRNAILPLLPAMIQHRMVRDEARMPPWLERTVARRYGLDRRAAAPSRYAGRRGQKYRDAVLTEVEALVDALTTQVLEEALDVRHPFLYRPLVEFALRLPPELCARPHARKWILREAMRGILPEGVRTRVGKGGPNGRLAWSLAAQRAILAPLLKEPILADLGVINASRLRSSFDMITQTPDNREKRHNAIHHTLAVEAWLQMRSGRWPPRANVEQKRVPQ
jgi:asparagine synthase (glutamine-hydrolysing)